MKTKPSLRGIIKFQYYLHQTFIIIMIFISLSHHIVSITSIITSNKQTNKKGKKILLLSQLYQQTLALCPVPLCSLLKAYYVLQAEAIVAALLHD